jgi:hypothetical protein
VHDFLFDWKKGRSTISWQGMDDNVITDVPVYKRQQSGPTRHNYYNGNENRPGISLDFGGKQIAPHQNFSRRS